jgi:hypothetical protein
MKPVLHGVTNFSVQTLSEKRKKKVRDNLQEINKHINNHFVFYLIGLVGRVTPILHAFILKPDENVECKTEFSESHISCFQAIRQLSLNLGNSHPSSTCH